VTAVIRRVRSLARAELLLLLRNKTALFSAFVLPLGLIGLAAGVRVEGSGLSVKAFLITSLLGFVLLAAVYYNLVTAYVARREDLVLKRLRAGELTDREILAGVAAPAIAVALVQCVLAGVAGAVFLGLPVPVNAVLLVVAVAGGMVVFVLLAAASAAFTRTAELAQVTTLPVLMACLLGSGLMLPLETLPDQVANILRALPLTPVVDLLRLGWVGTTGAAAPADFAGVLGPAARPLGLLAVWLILGTVAVRRWFRWEPRR
jgi:ABC-2 type transport system permease protein